MQVERVNNVALSESKLPDGSRVVVDASSETVVAMNATAGAAWDACSQPTTLEGIAAEMHRSGIDPSTAEDAIFQLREKNLVVTSEPPQPSRRSFIAAMAAVPVVAAMSMAEQKAFAERAGSLERDDERRLHHHDHYDPGPKNPEHFKLP
jgi:hypothetical protein